MTNTLDTQQKHLVLIDFKDKHSNGKGITPFFRSKAENIVQAALVSYTTNPKNPYDTDDRAFFYTDALPTNQPTMSAENIIEIFKESDFTQGRFSFVIVPKNNTILSANIYNISGDHHLPPPDNVQHHHQCEIDFQTKLKSGRFDYLL